MDCCMDIAPDVRERELIECGELWVVLQLVDELAVWAESHKVMLAAHKDTGGHFVHRSMRRVFLAELDCAHSSC